MFLTLMKYCIVLKDRREIEDASKLGKAERERGTARAERISREGEARLGREDSRESGSRRPVTATAFKKSRGSRDRTLKTAQGKSRKDEKSFQLKPRKIPVRIGGDWKGKHSGYSCLTQNLLNHREGKGSGSLRRVRITGKDQANKSAGWMPGH